MIEFIEETFLHGSNGESAPPRTAGRHAVLTAEVAQAQAAVTAPRRIVIEPAPIEAPNPVPASFD